MLQSPTPAPPVPVCLCLLLLLSGGRPPSAFAALSHSSEIELQGLRESNLGRFNGYGQDKKKQRSSHVIGSGQVGSLFLLVQARWSQGGSARAQGTGYVGETLRAAH